MRHDQRASAGPRLSGSDVRILTEILADTEKHPASMKVRRSGCTYHLPGCTVTTDEDSTLLTLALAGGLEHREERKRYGNASWLDSLISLTQIMLNNFHPPYFINATIAPQSIINANPI